MASDPQQPRKIRTFIALDLPDEIRAGLAAWGAKELRDEALLPIPEESLHVTLCFLGHIPAKDVDRAAAIVTALDPRPVPMTLQPAPVAKPRGRPGIFAIDVDSPAATELQEELATPLVAAGLYEREKRPFWPHLTVARVRTERGRKRRPRRVRRRPGELPLALVHTFGSVRTSLYRSNLRPDGARYERLAGLDLPPVK
jgi:RNA 2',3'-cyclic 3'-phosphodiesterase